MCAFYTETSVYSTQRQVDLDRLVRRAFLAVLGRTLRWLGVHDRGIIVGIRSGGL